MKKAGALMLFFGAAGFFLPLLGKQLTILLIFGPIARGVALVVGIIGVQFHHIGNTFVSIHR